MEDDESNEGNKVHTRREGDHLGLFFDLSKDLGKLSSTGKNVLVTTYNHVFENMKGEKITVTVLAYKKPPSAEINMYG